MKNRLLVSALVVGALAGAVVATSTPKRGCGAKCCQRPASAPVEACLRIHPLTGEPHDFGAENSMPASHAVGDGCAPAECVAGEGIQPEAP